MSTSEKGNNEPLPLHEKAWNQKQFFVAILSRYVDVLDEIGKRNQILVDTKDFLGGSLASELIIKIEK